MDITTRRKTSWIKSLAAMLGFIAILFSLLFITIDNSCHSTIKQWLPHYPDAKVISEDFNFIRPQGIGTSLVILSSEDDSETVKQFYRDNNIALMQDGASRGLASMDWSVEDNPDNDGSLIMLYSECAQN